MTFRVLYEAATDGSAFADMQKNIQKAATAAVKQAAIVAVSSGRQQIQSAGLSRRFVTGYRFRMETQANNEPSAVVFDTLGFISVFEEGQTIKGKPLLWLPLSNLPASIKAMSPKKFARTVAPLHSIVVPGRPPMLGAAIRDSASIPKVTRAKLKKGRNAKRGVLRTVPIFVGIPVANIRKRLSLKDVVKRAAALIPLFYAKNLEE